MSGDVYKRQEVSREWYVTELYNLHRKYEDWKESLKAYVNDNNYNVLNKVINPIMNIFTDGDVTNMPNVGLITLFKTL